MATDQERQQAVAALLVRLREETESAVRGFVDDVVTRADADRQRALDDARRAADAAVPLVFLAMWQLHYLNRTFIYPFRTRTAGKTMPAIVVLRRSATIGGTGSGSPTTRPTGRRSYRG